jgi:hypothetical protein
VVLRSPRPFPLDLIELLRKRLDAATPAYFSRALAHRGEDLMMSSPSSPEPRQLRELGLQIARKS